MKDLLHPSPAVGFEQPFAMLEACHERVRRSLALLGRLIEHIERRGHDAKSRSAARDVLRYFDLAAPHHHEDEERHVFPRLLAAGDAALAQTVQRLNGDHERMTALWARLRPVLEAWTGAEQARWSLAAVSAWAHIDGVALVGRWVAVSMGQKASSW